MVLEIFVDDQERIWIGHNEGLDQLNNNGNRLRHFSMPHNNPRSESGFVTAIQQSKDNLLWVGTIGGGLFLVDPDHGIQKQFLRTPDTPNSIISNLVSALEIDRDHIWIGTRRGLSRYNPQTDTFQHYLGDAVAARSASADISSITSDLNGKIWITSRKGLFYYHPQKDTVAQFQTDDAALSEALDVTINGIFHHKSGNYWIATENGLVEMTPAGELLRHLSELNGLSSSYICDIQGDDNGNLWVSTFSGFFRLNPTADHADAMRIFTVDDGIQSHEFNADAAFRHPGTGELFFGGINGFNRFYPNQVIDNPSAPPVALTAFRKFDKTVLSGRALMETDLIELNHSDQFFAFEFSALDYTIPEKNQYAYKMVGFDDRWIRSGNRRFASYTNLDAGEYRFRVRAANNDGIWNNEGVDINIIIHPPYWETWWFRALLIMALIAALWIAYHLRIQKLLALERIRIRIASDLHDDIGSSLTKIALYADLMRNGSSEADSEKMLSKIGKLSRDLVVTMSDIVWSIDARNDTYGDLLDRMHDFATGLLSPGDIAYVIDTEGISEAQKIPANIRQNLYLIFKEAVNNVARHSQASKVHITMQQQGQQFRLNIRDNGCGNTQALRQTGHGLRNMQMRAERLGGQLVLKDNEGLELDLIVDKL